VLLSCDQYSLTFLYKRSYFCVTTSEIKYVWKKMLATSNRLIIIFLISQGLLNVLSCLYAILLEQTCLTHLPVEILQLYCKFLTGKVFVSRRLEPKSRSLLCWRTSRTRRKVIFHISILLYSVDTHFNISLYHQFSSHHSFVYYLVKLRQFILRESLFVAVQQRWLILDAFSLDGT